MESGRVPPGDHQPSPGSLFRDLQGLRAFTQGNPVAERRANRQLRIKRSIVEQDLLLSMEVIVDFTVSEIENGTGGRIQNFQAQITMQRFAEIQSGVAILAGLQAGQGVAFFFRSCEIFFIVRVLGQPTDGCGRMRGFSQWRRRRCSNCHHPHGKFFRPIKGWSFFQDRMRPRLGPHSDGLCPFGPIGIHQPRIHDHWEPDTLCVASDGLMGMIQKLIRIPPQPRGIGLEKIAMNRDSRCSSARTLECRHTPPMVQHESAIASLLKIPGKINFLYRDLRRNEPHHTREHYAPVDPKSCCRVGREKYLRRLTGIPMEALFEIRPRIRSQRTFA